MADEIMKLSEQTFVPDSVQEDYDMLFGSADEFQYDASYVDEIISEFNFISEQLLTSIRDILMTIDGSVTVTDEGI
ncbi:hypothetical protein QA584_17810 [Anaerocolumna sp. AGMB13025]|uniref:hypothetical protein n=1 Tax=Anaerocolumna sp. AGMB13025 TaxID=3039116 RepID=UPI00241E8DB6|nr:hypothetical protein [Anaerocolumna sp. AGMB13025]WFR55455.1 hypothetical protein QA584_17810 [Anaerocolumna sp. AGMB13025]